MMKDIVSSILYESTVIQLYAPVFWAGFMEMLITQWLIKTVMG